MQNSVEAGAAEITLRIEETGGDLRIRLEDDGAGMDAATLSRALDPFFTDGVKHPDRRVGLGLPFLRQLADATGGHCTISSEPGRGTLLNLVVPRDHLDLPPTGDLPSVLQQAMCFAGEYDMTIAHRRDDEGYEITRDELLEVLGELDTVGSQALLREFIAAQETSLTDTEAEAWRK